MKIRFHIPLPPQQAKALSGHALTSLGLAIDKDLGYGFVASEKFQFGITWPATLNVIISQGDAGMSLINQVVRRRCQSATGANCRAGKTRARIHEGSGSDSR